MTAASAQVAIAETAVAVKGQCPEQTARNLTRQIQALLGEASKSLENASDLIREAYDRRAWAALGYDSWEDYCTAELGTPLLRLGRAVRQRLVGKLTSGGMSNRSVASALGISEITVRRDLKSGATDVAPDPEPEEVEVSTTVEIPAPPEVSAEVEILAEAELREEGIEEVRSLDSVRRVTGADGKSYPTKPRSKRRRPPLPDAFLQAARDLDKAAQRLVRLTEDDRFRNDAAGLGGRGDIQRAADAIRTVLDALAEAGNG